MAKIIAYCQSVTERWTSLFGFFLSNYNGPNLTISFSQNKGQLKSQNVDWFWCNSYRQTRLHLFSPNLNQVSLFYILIQTILTCSLDQAPNSDFYFAKFAVYIYEKVRLVHRQIIWILINIPPDFGRKRSKICFIKCPFKNDKLNLGGNIL